MSTAKRLKRNASHSKTPSPESASASLLQAAKHLFARKGLNGTSIRDIAQEAGVNSSLISYYFQGKEGLYRACLKEIGEQRFSVAQQILQPPNNKDDFRVRLSLFIDNLFELYLEDIDTGLIVIREYDRINSPAEDVFKNTFLKIVDLAIAFFEEAQKADVIDAKKDPFVMASLLFGCISSQMRLDHIKGRHYERSLKDPKEREKTKNHIIDLFLV